jgi:hypothetical protein
MQVVHLSLQGISTIIGMPGLVEAMENLDEETLSDESEKRIEQAKEDAELAQREADSGFPLVHAQAVVTLWTYLESLIRSFVSEWIRNQEGAKGIPEVSRLKIRLADYEALTEDEKYFYIFDLFEQETAAGLRSGINRFETLLAPFNLSGDVPDEIGKSIFELGHIRNVLVHRAGIADKRFVESCPWLSLSVGDEVRVTHGQLENYADAVQQYTILLIVRVGESFGVDMTHVKSGVMGSTEGDSAA